MRLDEEAIVLFIVKLVEGPGDDATVPVIWGDWRGQMGDVGLGFERRGDMVNEFKTEKYKEVSFNKVLINQI